MKKITCKLILFIVTFLGIWTYSQEKENFLNIPNILQKIVPNSGISSWILLYNDGGKDQPIVTSGAKPNYTPQSSGFDLFPEEDSFYYIAYSQGGKVGYVTDLQALKIFIGKIDNVQEAAIAATMDGYFVDEEFKDIAGNYYEDGTNYYLGLGKLTSKECPYQKKHYTLTINKSTGEISEVDDHGAYIELYNKTCTNNPRLLKLEQKKEEPKEEPTKKVKRSTKK
ncbi:hypothetical protein D1631_02980 [Chryseobacterium nematophagum]|uniref:WG repeat-containing protein n=1 Tax=Chryseobacterium nematophagum TaxID=2305228 RepID=A0A3M7TFI0_9FLAO|nr:hypothetical protein [Chryseobacterium nematophagum]RNA60970.1 hypothetical protein D1631_02980 [Chryseobacterium nematophagum]